MWSLSPQAALQRSGGCKEKQAFMQSSLVLASDAGGLKEVIEDKKTGFLFEKDNAEMLLQKLDMLYVAHCKKQVVLPPISLFKAYEKRFTLAHQMNILLALCGEKTS